jgi:DNA-binding NtrC family response regulator
MRVSILIIDDDPDVTDIIKRILKSEGYKVYTANDLDQAKVVITENNIHLVIMDLLLPGQDGALMVEELKKVDEKLKIIFLTGHYNFFEVECIGLDVYKVFLKPVDAEVLLSTIIDMQLEEKNRHVFVDVHQKK